MVTVEIPMTLPSAGNMHEHWRKRHQRIKAQRNATRLMLQTKGPASGAVHHFGILNRILVATLTRISPRKLDSDNLAFAFKGIRDEIAAYFGVDDADPRIIWQYAQAKGPASVRIDFEVRS